MLRKIVCVCQSSEAVVRSSDSGSHISPFYQYFWTTVKSHHNTRLTNVSIFVESIIGLSNGIFYWAELILY